MSDPRLAATRGILFDKDGTLIDFVRTWFPANRAVLRTLADGDATRLERLEQAAGVDSRTGGFDASSTIIAGSTADFGPALAAAIPCPFDEKFLARLDALIEREGLAFTTPIGEPSRICATLAARGFRLGLATNGPSRLAVDHARTIGVLEFLDFICGYDSGHGRKPAPGMALAFAAAIGLQPNEIAVVGDTLHDLHMARAAGAIAIAVPSGLTPAATLAPHADILVPDLDALVEAL